MIPETYCFNTSYFHIFMSYQVVYGYIIEIQTLFFMDLRRSMQLLQQNVECIELIEEIVKQLHALS